ncbi:MAG TPA: right-handed parallel beta-helix repeat-containing protein [Bacteroidales bacterium]|nr:right-handed parallel beta-helix repeat-containing protein [Bacteroidales bacterium]
MINKVVLVAVVLIIIQLKAVSQANIDTTNIENILYVNINHNNADNTNAGLTPEQPLKTLQHAINLAKDKRSKIIIYPGHYRSYIDIVSDELMFLEATEPGKVYVSGSDIYSEWVKEDTIFTHEWSLDWGYFDDSDFCFGPCQLSDYQKRRELIFIDSAPVKQVLKITDLGPNTFYIDEVNDRILLNPPDSVNLQNATVEVATRGYDIYGEGRNGSLVRATVFGGKGMIIRGITFQHTANTAHQDALTISNTTNLLVENCVFQWNNAVGFEMLNCSNITVKKCITRYNGERGMGVGGGESILIDDVKIYENNWRTNAPKIIAHDAAGIKLYGSINNCTLNNIKARNNYCNAIWFDWNNGNYTIQNSTINDNQKAGIMLEASRKSAYVRNCTLMYNGDGIMGYGHANVTVDSCFMFANNNQISLGQDGRTVGQDDDWEINCEDWTIKNSTIVSASPTQGMISFFAYLSPTTNASNNYYTTATADSNRYYHPRGDEQWPDGNKVSGGQLSLEEWRNKTGQDLNSVWMKPSAADVGGNLPPVANIEYKFFNDTIVQFYANNSMDPEELINSYKWYFGDGETSDKMNVNHFYSTVGVMDVSLVVTDFFGESDSVSVSINVGQKTNRDLIRTNAIGSVFPNPVLNVLHINLSSNYGEESAIIKIYDMKGQKVKEEYTILNNSGINPIDVSDLDHGIHVVSILMDSGLSGSCRFVK